MTVNDFLARFREKFETEKYRIASADGWILSLRPHQITLGAMLISSEGGEERFSDLGRQSGSGYFELLALAETISRDLFGARKLNAVALMMEDPIVHYHLLPRYDEPVELGSSVWEDPFWPGPPQFFKGKTDQETLERIHSAVMAHLKARTEARELQPWMMGALRHYERCDEIFHRKFGDHLFAVGGTLLGGIRDGGFISHDKDMDVAYLSGKTKRTHVREEFVDRIIALLDMGERVTIVDRSGNLQRRHAKWWSEDGSYVDLFPAYYDRTAGVSGDTTNCPPDDMRN